MYIGRYKLQIFKPLPETYDDSANIKLTNLKTTFDKIRNRQTPLPMLPDKALKAVDYFLNYKA